MTLTDDRPSPPVRPRSPCDRCRATPAPRSAASTSPRRSPAEHHRRHRRRPRPMEGRVLPGPGDRPRRADRVRPPASASSPTPTPTTTPRPTGTPRSTRCRPSGSRSSTATTRKRPRSCDGGTPTRTSGTPTSRRRSTRPPGSVLRAEVVPEFGGDTTWTNLVAAYEGLSPTAARVPRQAAGRAPLRRRPGAPRPGRRLRATPITKNRLIARHPVVRVHPLTGERALFVNQGFTSRIIGLRAEESARLLDLLFDHLTRPEYTVRFKWEPGSVAFWDNRATAHLGPQDIDHLDVDRILHRVTLIGEVPVGVDGSESELIEGTPFVGVPLFSAGRRRRRGVTPTALGRTRPGSRRPGRWRAPRPAAAGWPRRGWRRSPRCTR